MPVKYRALSSIRKKEKKKNNTKFQLNNSSTYKTNKNMHSKQKLTGLSAFLG